MFASFGVGTLLIAHAIEEAVRARCHSFDFFRGRQRYNISGVRSKIVERVLRPAKLT